MLFQSKIFGAMPQSIKIVMIFIQSFTLLIRIVNFVPYQQQDKHYQQYQYERPSASPEAAEVLIAEDIQQQ